MRKTASLTSIQARALAEGFQPIWKDAEGRIQSVRDEDLDRLLYAYLPDYRRERTDPEGLSDPLPALLTADAGAPVVLPSGLKHLESVEIALEGGDKRLIKTVAGTLPAGLPPGYHSIIAAPHTLPLAVAPTGRSQRLAAITPCWGPAIQIPSLRGKDHEPFGTFDMLPDAARLFARAGADLIALSPTAAVSHGSSAPLSPYSPSSRRFLNTLLLGGFASGADESPELIDWDSVRSQAPQVLHDTYARTSPNMISAFHAWRKQQSEAILDHAAFNVLADHLGEADWRRWPAEFRNRSSAATAAFKDRHRTDIDVQLYAQWRANSCLEQAQSTARSEGMAIGLIGDLPIGVAPGGSDVWRDPQAFLQGLTVGAPPDPLGPDGQLWGVTTFRPDWLRQDGFKAWIALLRSAFAMAGAVRIDHGFGLERLWVVAGDDLSSCGAYLSYPRDDLFRLLALEAYRAGGHVILEDLGTRPSGFGEHMDRYGFLGMRVLWFEQDDQGNFGALAHLPGDSVAMTSTHDTPTLAGWWQGQDIKWRDLIKPGFKPKSAEIQRAVDRTSLWNSIGGVMPQPETDHTEPVVDHAIEAVATSPSWVKIVPMEDLIGLAEQPNLPGTTTEHPNWRRRLPAPLNQLLNQKCVARRIRRISKTTRRVR